MNLKEVLLDLLSELNKEVIITNNGIAVHYEGYTTVDVYETEYVYEADSIEELMEHLSDISSKDTTLLLTHPYSKTDLVTMGTVYVVEYFVTIIDIPHVIFPNEEA